MNRRSLLRLAVGCLAALDLPWRAKAQQPHASRYDILPLLQADYQGRLEQDGIPLDPAHRTPAQAHTAALQFWAVKNQAAIQATTITQHALEAAVGGNHFPHFPPNFPPNP
jgi:hypothetical protein